MPHQRQLIREAVKAALLNQTAAQGRVEETRLVPARIGELPTISVFSNEEDSEKGQEAPRELKRRLVITVECRVGVPAGGALDDSLDAIAQEVERAMHADPTLGGKCQDSFLSGTNFGTVAGAERPLGAVQLLYAVTYWTGAPEAADVEADNLKTINVKTSLSGQVIPDDQAEDQLEDLDQ